MTVGLVFQSVTPWSRTGPRVMYIDCAQEKSPVSCRQAARSAADPG